MKELLVNNTWSNNKYVNLSINVLMFLLSINFFHYGQLLLPIICLIIFVDRKFHIEIKNKTLFVLLILFSIAFFLFTYKVGFYSTMGFCLPMAYYIGCNINNNNKIKNVIVIVIFGMIMHLLLNAFYELNRFGLTEFLSKIKRYDIWTKDVVASTATATNAILLFSCFYYCVFNENDKNIKFIYIVLFTLSFTYIFIMRRRTPILILLISFFVSLVFDFCFLKNKNYNKVLQFLKITLFVLAFIIVIYLLNLFGFKDYINGFSLIRVFIDEKLSSNRLNILLEGIKYVPNYLYGGGQISNIIGYEFHDLLFNIYDYAGIVPFTLMLIICAIMMINTIRKLFNSKLDRNIRILILGLFIGISLMLCVEPIMTGSSLFLIIAIVLYGIIEEF